MSVQIVVKNSRESLGEGPHWDETSQNLLYVDIVEGGIHRWNSQTGVDEVHKFSEYYTMCLSITNAKYGYHKNKMLVSTRLKTAGAFTSALFHSNFLDRLPVYIYTVLHKVNDSNTCNLVLIVQTRLYRSPCHAIRAATL